MDCPKGPGIGPGLGRHFLPFLPKNFPSPLKIVWDRSILRQCQRAGSVGVVPEVLGEKGEVTVMLRFALLFFVLALIAGVLGLGGLAGDLAYIGKILFFVFIVMFIVSLVLGRRGGGPVI
jgi:uncharacterized membrane protein YtjA (UPF0391 family)